MKNYSIKDIKSSHNINEKIIARTFSIYYIVFLFAILFICIQKIEKNKQNEIKYIKFKHTLEVKKIDRNKNIISKEIISLISEVDTPWYDKNTKYLKNSLHKKETNSIIKEELIIANNHNNRNKDLLDTINLSNEILETINFKNSLNSKIEIMNKILKNKLYISSRFAIAIKTMIDNNTENKYIKTYCEIINQEINNGLSAIYKVKFNNRKLNIEELFIPLYDGLIEKTNEINKQLYEKHLKDKNYDENVFLKWRIK